MGEGAPTGHPPEQGSSGGCPQRPCISAEESDALYILVSAHMEGWPFDLPRLPTETREDGDHALARIQEANEDMRLLNDIGWGQGAGKAVELTMAPHELRRALGRYREEATSQLASEEREEAEAQADSRRSREAATLTVGMCKRVLDELTVQKRVPPSTTPSITDRQRAALMAHLFEIANRAWGESLVADDIERVAAEVHDSVSLIAGIGLEVVPGHEVDLTMSPGELGRMFAWIKESVAEGSADHPVRRELLLEACDRVLSTVASADIAASSAERSKTSLRCGAPPR